MTQVATTLQNVYGESASAVAGVLETVGYAVTKVEQALTIVFHLTTTKMIDALSTGGFTNTAIASLGTAFTSVGSYVTTTVGNFFITTIGGLF